MTTPTPHPTPAPAPTTNAAATPKPPATTTATTTGTVDIARKLAAFTEHWAPRRIARVNDYEVKIAKLRGEFVWHAHEDTDELFLVVAGTLTIRLRDGDVVLGPGELYVVPRGVEHCPAAAEEVSILLFEPTGTTNTGDRPGPRTREPLDA
ncbi:cupin domain-containing protein [Streptomyces sp. NPDC051000]|uniref:cupin domain-containing protein n=1 Tax=Streptomyces sp. NPDC051000 TaxID=3155520 RepID=UPI0033DAC3C9